MKAKCNKCQNCFMIHEVDVWTYKIDCLIKGCIDRPVYCAYYQKRKKIKERSNKDDNT